MLFLVMCWDRPDAGAARDALMPQHKPYIAPFLDSFRVGGFITDDEGRPIGSMAVCEADSLAQARALFENDPYFGAVWQCVEVHPYRPMAGTWIGGPQWKTQV